ncbi:MAG: aminopeptidase P family protein [Anaerolineales bacterium]|nr:MAG: aminopeptidase P family protein [Anaerolineales bacterium]
MRMRLARLRQTLADNDLDAIVISQPENRRYLSGFTGTGGVLFISPERAVLATTFVYLEQARKQAPAFELVRFQREFVEVWPDLVTEINARRVAFESAHLTVAEQGKLDTGAEGAELVPTEGIVEGFRAIKDRDELDIIRKAVVLADAAFTHIVGFIEPGMTEREVAWALEVYMRTHGAEKAAFDLIVGAGPNGAMPHHEVSERVIGVGEPIVMDLGARIAGYHSDLTRTICLGQPDGRFTEIYDVVLRAQLAAEAAIRAGLVTGEADSAARQVIAEAGYGEQYGHGLGHGVGLAVQEEPSIRQGAEEVLKPGMVFTVEPGIYLPDWGGVRIEDMVLVREDGVEVLSQASKEPVIIK